MLPFDKRPLPAALSAEARRNIETARALRDTPAKCLIEGLLALKGTGPGAFDDYVVRRYIESEFPGSLDAYLAKIPDAADLLEIANTSGHLVSPLASAIRFGSELTAGSEVIAARHLRVVSDLIVKAVRGTGKRKICVCMPFRHGKSMLSSLALPIWLIGNYPWMTIGLTAGTSSLAHHFSRQIRNIFQNNQDRLPALASDSQSSEQFHTEHGGGLWTGSTSSGILGKGCNLLIADDLIASAELASTRNGRDAAWRFLIADAMSRGQDFPITLVCCTRWDVDDIPGRLMSGYDGVDSSEWEFLTLSAISEAEDPITGRRAGEALFPEKRPLAELESFRRSMPAELWACGFQNTPLQETNIGKAYKSFSERDHVSDFVEFDPELPIRCSWDFNINPSAVVCANARIIRPANPIIDMVTRGVYPEVFDVSVFDELLLNDVTTEETCSALGEKLRRYADIARRFTGRRLKVVVTGDSSGNQRRTSASSQEGARTDWQIVRKFFERNSDVFDAEFHLRKSNGSVRDRVAKVNGLFYSADGNVRMRISSRCRGLVADLKAVRWAKDSFGNTLDVLDKKDSRVSHLTDALGYLAVDLGVGQQPIGEQPYAIWG